jgi:hypothetical protein
MDDPPCTPIGPEQAELIGSRVSIIVGSRDAALRPHAMRALGCTLSGDRRVLTLLLPLPAAAPVLDDLRDNGRIAVVFSQPSTNRTLQLKGEDAQLLPGPADARALAARHLANFIAETGTLGLPAEVGHTLHSAEGGMAAVCFTVREAFEQTPGPHAGERIGAAR